MVFIEGYFFFLEIASEWNNWNLQSIKLIWHAKQTSN